MVYCDGIIRISRGFVKVFLWVVSLFSPLTLIHCQEPCKQDTSGPFCFIEKFTVTGSYEQGGSPIFFPVIAYDNCSAVSSVEFFLVNEGREIAEGEILPCGIHIIQGIFIDAEENLTNCEFVVEVNCTVLLHSGLFPHQMHEAAIKNSNRIIEDHDIKMTNFELGSLSVIWESGKRGPGTISRGSRDPGGTSYGIYQLSHKQGYIDDFLHMEGNAYKGDFGTLRPGTEAFNVVWRDIAIRDPEGFRKAQHDFIKRTHYDKYAERVRSQIGLDINEYSMVLKDVLWSTAVQHGPFNNIFKNALRGSDLTKLSEKEIIQKIYSERRRMNGNRLAHFSRVGGSWKKSLIQRFESEERVALSRLDAYYDNYVFHSTSAKGIADGKIDEIPEMDEKIVSVEEKSPKNESIMMNNSTLSDGLIVQSENSSSDNHIHAAPGDQLFMHTEAMQEKHTKVQEISVLKPVFSPVIPKESKPEPVLLPIKEDNNVTYEKVDDKKVEETNVASVYRILFVVLSEPDAIFPELKDLGLLIRDNLEHINQTRYLIGDFSNVEEAEEVKQKIYQRGYKAATVTQYQGAVFAGIVN